MRANWQECKHYSGPQGVWVGLHVTLSRKGAINLTKATFEKMGEPDAVHVFFDATNNRFGLKPTSPSTRNAFPMGSQGKRGGRRVYVASVLKEFRIDIPETIQFFDADFDDEGILVLDLRTARVPNRVLNHPSKRAKTGGSSRVFAPQDG